MSEPHGISKLPTWGRYRVPWFVTLWNGDTPEFRVVTGERLQEAMRTGACWICGERVALGTFSFAIGPMCTVNRVSAEPPQHRDCAVYAAKHCPFLTDPARVRRDANLPADSEKDGGMIERNPGVTAIWSCQRYAIAPGADSRILFRLGDPSEVLWYHRGRLATREEVTASYDAGCPTLEAFAQQDGPEAVALLSRMQEAARRYFPNGKVAESDPLEVQS